MSQIGPKRHHGPYAPRMTRQITNKHRRLSVGLLTTPLTSEAIACKSRVAHTCFQGWSVGTAVATNGCSCGCPPAGHRHKPGGGSLWYGDQPHGGRRHGVLCSKGDMVSPRPLPRSPGLGTGTRFEGSHYGGIWAHGVGLHRATCKEIEGEQKRKIGISQSPAHGQGGGPMGPFFGIILTCGVSHPLHIGRLAKALLWSSNQIAPRPNWAQIPRSSIADLVVDRAGAGSCAVGGRGAVPSRERACCSINSDEILHSHCEEHEYTTGSHVVGGQWSGPVRITPT